MKPMTQDTWSADDEGIQLTYSTLPPGNRSHSSPDLLRDEQPEPAPVQAPWGVLPQSSRRVLNAAFVGAVLGVGMLVGSVLLAPALSLRPASMPSAPNLGPSVHTLPTRTPAPALGAATDTVATVDARFAILSLGVHCVPDACSESRPVPAGQHIYALQGGWSCTTLRSGEVVDHDQQVIYCRLDQPNVFNATFDGAPFDCVGARLGCHFVLAVKTTDGR
jgi:hypothetical protein